MPERPWTLHYRPSAWGDPLDEVMSSLMPAYNAGVPRHDLEAVRRLLERAAPARSARRVVVVGTNGKSSTATYLARMLTGRGVRTGLSTSPHLRSWTERVRIDLEPVAAEDLAATVRRVHAVAAAQEERRGDLRFFDVLTIATEDLFGRAGVEVGVFEAGIGGRLDGTRVLDAELVLLTSIGADHQEILGREPAQRLWEKALATAPGATLLSAPLGPELAARLHEIAEDGGFAVEVVRPAPAEDDHGETNVAAATEGATPEDRDAARRIPAVQRANLALAQAAAHRLGTTPASSGAIDPSVEGRFHRTIIDGVPVLADVAHNVTAWHAFLAELPARAHVALVAITEPREPAELAEALAAARDRVDEVVVTGTRVRPPREPEAVAAAIRAAGVPAVAIAEPEAAFGEALRRARAADAPLAAFGSNYLVVDLLAWADARR